MDLGTAPQGDIPTVVLLGETLTLQPPLALLEIVDMLDSETAATATFLLAAATDAAVLAAVLALLLDLPVNRRDTLLASPGLLITRRALSRAA